MHIVLNTDKKWNFTFNRKVPIKFTVVKLVILYRMSGSFPEIYVLFLSLDSRTREISLEISHLAFSSLRASGNTFEHQKFQVT